MQAETFRSACELNYHEKYPHNIFKAMRIIAREEGVRALYQGLTASMIGVLHPLIYFPLYEKSKIYFLNNVQSDPRAPLESKYVFVSAISCKALTSLLTYPHEVIRARQQDHRASENNHKPSLARTITQLRAEGFLAFYSGYATNLVRILPHYAITFVLYERFSLYFHSKLD